MPKAITASEQLDSSNYQVRSDLSKLQQIFQSILDQEASNNTLQRTYLSAKTNRDRGNVCEDNSFG